MMRLKAIKRRRCRYQGTFRLVRDVTVARDTTLKPLLDAEETDHRRCAEVSGVRRQAMLSAGDRARALKPAGGRHDRERAPAGAARQ
jgi:hypothetical protein